MRNRYFWIVCGLVVIGAFLRLYNFADWMHYQLDQSRDFRVVQSALEYGPGELPLQGPRAAGSFLRLGPLLYYLEYGSAMVFGETPAGSVMVIAILNILAIPLFYLFVKNFFAQSISIGLTSIFSVSLFLITYSRFGWNPNLIMPFTLLFAYALVRIGENEDIKKGRWLVVASVALAGVTNMHFVAFVTMPLVAVIYFLWMRPIISVRYWILSVAVFLFLNSPLIINDIKTGGENFRAFFDVVLDRGGGEALADGEERDVRGHSLLDKVVYNVGQHTQFYWMILTGDQMAAIPALDGNDLQCNYDCRHGLMRGVLSFIVFLCGFAGWFFLYRNEQSLEKRNFLRVILIWSLVLFAVYTPLAYDLAPRFFLLNAPLAFVIPGLIMQIILLRCGNVGRSLVIGVSIVCVGLNVYFVTTYFGELSRAAHDPSLMIEHHDRILKEKVRVTYEQMQDISVWMRDISRKNDQPVFFDAQLEYKRAFSEILSRENVMQDGFSSCNTIYQEGNYFLIIRTQSDQKNILEKFSSCLDIVEKKVFGTLTVYKMMQKTEAITAQRKSSFEDARDPVFADGVQKRYLWRQIFE